ncbi:hypothetical protein GOP47_0029744 [Adiantum capillus-veneris]|nr:hypothetical protein GOP47_0029744 [Adiantum capillus-veneris]
MGPSTWWVAAVAVVSSVASLLAATRWRSSRGHLVRRVTELEEALEASVKQRAAERKGRIRAQQELRSFLLAKDISGGSKSSFPMVPIGFIQSCFNTRNGTPRQPLLVPLARACLVLSPGGVPATALDGLTGYSHCWLLYVFHANTDLPHVWSQPSHTDFKAKLGTIAKVEGVCGRRLLISGADLVDGTPVLDVKPYVPFCDIVPHATAPQWVKAGGEDDTIALASVEFSSTFKENLSKCWEVMAKFSMYSGPEEYQELVEQVLSRDIRSLRQRKNPQVSMPMDSFNDQALQEDDCVSNEDTLLDPEEKGTTLKYGNEEVKKDSEAVVYKLTLDGLIISYTVDCGHVVVHGVENLSFDCNTVRECNYTIWKKVAGSRTR